MSAGRRAHGAVRKARASALYEHLIEQGSDAIAVIADDLKNWGWTRMQVERAADDLVERDLAAVVVLDAGLIEIRPYVGEDGEPLLADGDDLDGVAA